MEAQSNPGKHSHNVIYPAQQKESETNCPDEEYVPLSPPSLYSV